MPRRRHLTRWSPGGYYLHVEGRKPERSEANWLEDALSGNRLLSRQRHLELLVFELLMLLEKELPNFEDWGQEETYETIRVLYKALAHGRRPDGTSYR